MFKSFKEFVLRGNVVDLAVGVVIGASFGSVVSALVKDLITPLISAIVKAPDFSNLFFTLNGSKFMYGDFINTVVSFLIIASTVYFFVVAPLNTMIQRLNRNKKMAEPDTKKCPECLSDIPKAARKCAHCASVLEQS